jgi:hypothetical protein
VLLAGQLRFQAFCDRSAQRPFSQGEESRLEDAISSISSKIEVRGCFAMRSGRQHQDAAHRRIVSQSRRTGCESLLLILNFRNARPLLSDDSFEIAFERPPNKTEPSCSESRKRQGVRGGSSCEGGCEKNASPNQMTRESDCYRASSTTGAAIWWPGQSIECLVESRDTQQMGTFPYQA